MTKTFTVPQHVHELIAKSRQKFGRRFFSDSVDVMLVQIETYESAEDMDQSTLECILKEQKLLLPGFRHIVIYPGRNGGRPGEICRRLCSRYYSYCFGMHGDFEFWESNASHGGCHYSPVIFAEMMALMEIFPEIMDWREFDESYEITEEEAEVNYRRFCDPQSFLPRLQELGLERWSASDAEKEIYYRGLNVLIDETKWESVRLLQKEAFVALPFAHYRDGMFLFKECGISIIPLVRKILVEEHKVEYYEELFKIPSAQIEACVDFFRDKLEKNP